MGIIDIEDMEFWAFHGCFKEEQLVGNKFLVNLSMKTNCEIAGSNDRLEDALDYQKAYDVVKFEIEISSKLLENVCSRILDGLYKQFNNQLLWAKVKVSKINPPMGGQMKCVSVTMEK
jgi:7,8-dihydroneopterin aldolase/epimerase/oxygenase